MSATSALATAGGRSDLPWRGERRGGAGGGGRAGGGSNSRGGRGSGGGAIGVSRIDAAAIGRNLGVLPDRGGLGWFAGKGVIRKAGEVLGFGWLVEARAMEGHRRRRGLLRGCRKRQAKGYSRSKYSSGEFHGVLLSAVL